jgi:hypothetical protein
MKLTPENKAHIDAMSVEQLLSGVRFSPTGNPWFQDETGDYWLQRLADLRSKDNAAYVQASKNIGWR